MKKLSEQKQFQQEYLLKAGSGFDCGWFAGSVEGADTKALQARVIEIGSELDCFNFARYVNNRNGDDIKLLEKRILQTTNAMLLNLFIDEIEGADKEALQARLDELGKAYND